jgi:ferric-dicitrate binding protein FerR (iron transport regulator)
MSGFLTAEGRLDLTELELALQELEAGIIDPVRRDELMALLESSPAAQRTYLAYFEMSAMLEAEAATHAESGNLPKIISYVAPATMFRRSLLAAAAVVVLGGAVAALIRVALPQTPELALTSAADSLWTMQGETRDAGGNKATVREGSTLRVESGTLELRLESGAAMVIQGPARVSFPKLNKPVLRSGWLWIDSGASHERFEVSTPKHRIRNLGTRFGVKVVADEPPEVHLIKGTLEVSAVDEPGKPRKLKADGRGLAIAAEGEPVALNLARDPFPGIAELLAAAPYYPTAIRAQNPAGYWRLGEAADGSLRNEVEGGATGRPGHGVSVAADGPGEADGFHGFPPDNRAAGFSGATGGSFLSLGSVMRKEGLLFEERFDGSGELNERSPKTAESGQRWKAASLFRADGTVLGGLGSATLPFKPEDGMIYTLEADFRDIRCAEGNPAWVALGYSKGQSAHTGMDHRFLQGVVTARAWMLAYGSAAGHDNKAFLNGTADMAFWEKWKGERGGDVDMRLTLDTSKGAGNWVATWYARRPGGDFAEVRAAERLVSESIDSVGIAVTGDSLRARCAGFSLKAEFAPDIPSARHLADGSAGMNRRSGALSCWVRRAPGKGRAEIIWSAGNSAADDFIHARLDEEGRVGFFIENGRHDVLLTSEESVADGRWHHLAASWSANSANLYLDGRRVAWEFADRDLLHGDLPVLRLGGGTMPEEAAPFTGEIGEVAVWDRALSPVEIGQQFRSARGESLEGRVFPE